MAGVSHVMEDDNHWGADGTYTTKGQPARCLSGDEHHLERMDDLVSHFFGCIEIGDREAFLDERNDVWAEILAIEQEDPGRVRTGFSDYSVKVSRFKGPDETELDKAERQQRELDEKKRRKRVAAALALESAFKRILLLRRSILENDSAKLIQNIRGSGKAWRRKARELSKDPNRQVWIANVQAERGRGHTERLNAMIKKQKHQDAQADLKGKRPEQSDNLPSQPSNKSQASEGGPSTQHPARQDELPTPSFSGNLDDDDANRRRNRWDDVRTTLQTIIYGESRNPPPESEGTPYDLRRDVKAQVIKFQSNPNYESLVKYSEKVDDEIFKGEFPDQQVSLEMLLLDKRFAKAVGSVALQYIHIPCNNMEWVQELVSEYHSQQLGNAHMILRPDCWRGQLHGSEDNTFVHTRHIRSLCERLTTKEVDRYSGQGDNTVLFMPFLHWETDRSRARMTEVIELCSDNHDLESRRTAWEERQDRIASRNELWASAKPTLSVQGVKHEDFDFYREPENIKKNNPKLIEDLIWAQMREERYRNEPCDFSTDEDGTITESDYESENPDETINPMSGRNPGGNPHLAADPRGQEDLKRSIYDSKVPFKNIFRGVRLGEYRRLRPQHPLAQYLIDAARLFEAMSTYQDRQLLEQYLFKRSALHPRRTLDQAYFWRLKTTRRRDRDQVVYRHTHADQFHRLHSRSYLLPRPSPFSRGFRRAVANFPKLDPLQYLPSMLGGRGARDGADDAMKGYAWTNHGQYEDSRGCSDCTDKVRKRSRAIMVDQLWMWVLDQNTILTCFPQRYGLSEKNDPSGVHQRIRNCLGNYNNPNSQVLSAFDLAVMILDNCYDTLFDGASTIDKRPRVLDIFGESIGNVINEYTIASKHLWDLSDRLTKKYESSHDADVTSKLLLPLLDVAPEARLQRIINDIIDELEIMKHLMDQQREVIEKFFNIAREMIAPKSPKHPILERVGEVLSEKAKLLGLNYIILPDEAHHDDPKLISFERRVKELQSKMKDREQEIEGLSKSAESTAANVNELLTLKQAQASVVQAYQANRQAEETMKQGRAIMLFTVMTIIFLPLSFMTSLFGMNAVELTSGGGSGGNSTDPPELLPWQIADFWPLTFRQQILIMFTVSAVVVGTVMILAFSPLAMSLVWTYWFSMLTENGTKLAIRVLPPSWYHALTQVDAFLEAKIERREVRRDEAVDDFDARHRHSTWRASEQREQRERDRRADLSRERHAREAEKTKRRAAREGRRARRDARRTEDDASPAVPAAAHDGGGVAVATGASPPGAPAVPVAAPRPRPTGSPAQGPLVQMVGGRGDGAGADINAAAAAGNGESETKPLVVETREDVTDVDGIGGAVVMWARGLFAGVNGEKGKESDVEAQKRPPR